MQSYRRKTVLKKARQDIANVNFNGMAVDVDKGIPIALISMVALQYYLDGLSKALMLSIEKTAILRMVLLDFIEVKYLH